MKIQHRKLVKLLQLAYSAEKAAAFAYIGHAGSVRRPEGLDQPAIAGGNEPILAVAGESHTGRDLAARAVGESAKTIATFETEAIVGILREDRSEAGAVRGAHREGTEVEDDCCRCDDREGIGGGARAVGPEGRGRRCQGDAVVSIRRQANRTGWNDHHSDAY